MPNSSTISTATYRVEIHPGTDLWMRGARFGEVQREYKTRGPLWYGGVWLKKGTNMVVIKMDKISQLVRCPAEDVTVL